MSTTKKLDGVISLTWSVDNLVANPGAGNLMIDNMFVGHVYLGIGTWHADFNLDTNINHTFCITEG